MNISQVNTEKPALADLGSAINSLKGGTLVTKGGTTTVRATALNSILNVMPKAPPTNYAIITAVTKKDIVLYSLLDTN